MSGALHIIGIDRLRPLLDRQKVIAAVREALILQAAGKVQSPLPGQLLFKEPHGDCHIKYGHVAGSPTFTIKVAAGFYDNPKLGLPALHGLVMVWDATTGAPLVLFQDGGWLTAWRTVAATAIAAHAMAPERLTEVGIIGSGLQADLAIEWLPELLGRQRFVVWSRTAGNAEALAARRRKAGYDVRTVTTAADVLASCNLVVTATPAETPLFAVDHVRPGTHLVAIGADSPGKQELPAELFPRAAHVLTDDTAQCVDHGELGVAVRAGLAKGESAIMLGDLLSGKVTRLRKPGDITIADLTGIAAEDIAISGLFSQLLKME